MEEQLVSLKTAILANEKGFDIPTNNLIWTKDNKSYPSSVLASLLMDEYYGIWQPTQGLLQKWLRETHDVDIIALPTRWTGDITIAYWTYAIKSIQPVGKQKYKFYTYEEALEVGLEEALKLI